MSQGAIAIKTCFIVATMALKPDMENQARELENKSKNDMHSLIENELKKTGRLCEQDPYDVREKRRLREEYHAMIMTMINDNDQCWGPWCRKNTTLFDDIKHSMMMTWTTQVDTLMRIGEGKEKEDEFKKSISTICFAIDWLMSGACDNAYAPLAEESMTHLWNMSNKITDSWMDHWKDNWMYIRDKDFIDSFDTIYDGAKFKEKKRMWNKISSSWTKFLEIKVFSRIYTIDMSAINVFLTNLIDILFLAQGIIEMQAKHMKALSIVDSFDDTYREIYNVARTIKSCLNGKIVLRHNCTCDRMPGKRSRTFASTRMLFELKEKKLEKKQKAQKKYIKSKIETWRSSSSFGNDEKKTMK
jgi:hypothetical protein